MQTSFTWHRKNRGQTFDRLNIHAFRRSFNRTGQKFERHNLGQIFSRYGRKFDQRDLNTITLAVRVQIPIIRRIPDSSSRITDSKSHDFAFHKQIVSLIPVSRTHILHGGETTAIKKQTKTITLYGARLIPH